MQDVNVLLFINKEKTCSSRRCRRMNDARGLGVIDDRVQVPLEW